MHGFPRPHRLKLSPYTDQPFHQRLEQAEVIIQHLIVRQQKREEVLRRVLNKVRSAQAPAASTLRALPPISPEPTPSPKVPLHSQHSEVLTAPRKHYRLRGKSGYYRTFKRPKADASIPEGGSQKKPAVYQISESSQVDQIELWRKVIDSSPDWLFVKDRNFRYLLVNQSYAKAIGKSVGEIIGRDDIELGFPEHLVFGDPEADIRGFRNDDIDALEGISIYNPHDPATTADGATCIFETQKVPLKDSQGQIFACLGVARDVTDRKAAENALKQKVEQETLINELTGHIRSSLDFEATVTTAVSKIRGLLGVDHCTFSWYRSGESASEQSYLETCYEAKEDQANTLLGSFCVIGLDKLMGKVAPQEIVQIDHLASATEDFHRGLGQLGRGHYQAILAIPLQIRPGLIGILGCHQAAERSWAKAEVELLQAIMAQVAIALKQAELYEQSQAKAEALAQALQALKNTQSHLLQSEKMSALGQMVAGIAHEINNPVNFIHGNLEHLNRYIHDLLQVIEAYQAYYPAPPKDLQDLLEEVDLPFLSEDVLKLMGSAKHGSARIKEIILSLRTFSRLDEAALQATDIHECLESTLILLQHRLRNKQQVHPIVIERNYQNLPPVDCYPGPLNQVLMNLLSNAIDALETHPQDRKRIRISTALIEGETPESDRIAIRIADNGGGIPDEVRSRIFDPFFTTKPIGKGTGLGLSISYQIITERHGGLLKCQSTPGKGTEFVIELPIHGPAEEPNLSEPEQR